MKIILKNILWIFVLKQMKHQIFYLSVTMLNVQVVWYLQFHLLCMVLHMVNALIFIQHINVLKKLILLLWKNVKMLLIVNF